MIIHMSRIIILAGALLMAAGVTFHLQGRSIVVPAESFMYGNPDWVGHGVWIGLSGAAVIVAGIILYARARTRRPPGRRA